MYSKKCDECGANLDPGERCDCKGQKEVDHNHSGLIFSKAEMNDNCKA